MDCKSIAQKLFSNKPQPPCTIDLELDESSYVNGQSFTNEDVARILIMILHEGMKMLHGVGPNKTVDLALLSDADFNNLNHYMKSLGYEMVLNVYRVNPPKITTFGVSEYPLTIRHKNGNNYMIYFKLFNPNK